MFSNENPSMHPFQSLISTLSVSDLQVGATGQSVASKIGDALFKDTSLEMKFVSYEKFLHFAHFKKQYPFHTLKNTNMNQTIFSKIFTVAFFSSDNRMYE